MIYLESFILFFANAFHIETVQHLKWTMMITTESYSRNQAECPIK